MRHILINSRILEIGHFYHDVELGLGNPSYTHNFPFDSIIYLQERSLLKGAQLMFGC